MVPNADLLRQNPHRRHATCDATRSTLSLSHASCNVAAMRAGDDEENSVKLV
jgi:hypothetical protein